MHKSMDLVLFCDNRAIVVYDNVVGIRAIPLPSENELPSAGHKSICPLCGNDIDDGQYTYMAQTYFYLLQRNFKKWSRQTDGKDEPYSYGESNTDTIAYTNNALPDTVDNMNGSCQANHRYRTCLSKFQYPEDDCSTNKDSQQCNIEVPKHIPPGLLVTGYYDRFFIEKMKLGSGSYGHVYHCVHVIDGLSLGEYAIKKLPVGDDRQWLRKMIREVKVREMLRHQNIVDYNHSWLEMYRLNEFCPYIPWLFVLMAYCNGGDLEKFVRNYKDKLTDEEIFVLLIDIVNGLSHLHRHGIIHRDLKPSNVLLNLDQKFGALALLSDFGTCELLAEISNHDVRRQGFTGTVEFTAPELLHTNESGELNTFYDTKSDMWSLGILLYFLCYGTLPYSDDSPRKCRDMILRHKCLTLPATKISAELQMLILSLTQVCPDLRPDCEDILCDKRIIALMQDESFIKHGRAKLALKLSTLDEVITNFDNAAYSECIPHLN